MGHTTQLVSADEARAMRDDGCDGNHEDVKRLVDTIIAQAAEIERLRVTLAALAPDAPDDERDELSDMLDSIAPRVPA